MDYFVNIAILDTYMLCNNSDVSLLQIICAVHVKYEIASRAVNSFWFSHKKSNEKIECKIF